MIEHRDADKVKAGTPLRLDDSSGYYDGLTEGKVYSAIRGAEEGIFSSRPYVSIADDDGKTRVLHLSRFSFA